MANLDRPNGITPVSKIDGSKIPTRQFVVTSVGSNLFVGDPVKAMAAGDIELAGAGEGVDTIGVIVGLYDSNGNPIGHPNSSISTKYLASGDSGFAEVALAMPDCLFRVQADGNTVAADRWTTADNLATAGDTTTARSRQELQTSSQATTGTKMFKIIDKVDEPNNDWGTNVDLLVTFNESMWFTAAAGL